MEKNKYHLNAFYSTTFTIRSHDVVPTSKKRLNFLSSHKGFLSIMATPFMVAI